MVHPLPHSLAIAYLIAALGLVAGAASADAEADPPRSATAGDPAGRIAFVLPDGRPALVDPASGATTVLRVPSRRAQFPTWSPDGEAVSVITVDGTGAALDVAWPARGVVQRVYESASEPPIYHGWSPTGEHVALLANRGDALGLYLIDRPGPPTADALSAPAPRLLATGAPFYWDWTPDGRSLLVHRNVLRPAAEAGISGLGEYALAPSFPTPGAFQSPAVSPSGAYVAYATRDAGDTRRVVIERRAAGAAPDTLPPSDGVARRELPHRGLAAFAWHPQRDVLAVQRAVVDAPHFYGPVVTVDATSGDLESVTDDDVALAFWWSPDGATIAYLAPVARGDPGREQQVRAPPVLAQRSGTGDRLALRVVDLDTGLRRELARFTPSAVFLTQYLPFFDQYARSHRLWSPASDALVMSVLDGTGTTVLRVYGLDGAVRTLVPGDMPAWNVR